MIRSRLLVLALSTSLCAGGVFAQGTSTPQFSADRFRSHVAFLADDLLEGRDTGSRGYDIAAAYVATQFEGLGLKPGGENGSWYQQVQFRTARHGAAKATMTVSGPGGTKTWENASDVAISASLFEAEQDITAPVVFVGYGIDSPENGLNDYKGLDVRGKIIAVLSGTPLGLPSEVAAHLGDIKTQVAARHGAIGVISISTARAQKTNPWAKSVTNTLGGTGYGWLGKDGKPADDAPGVRFSGTVNIPVAEALFAGAKENYASVQAKSEKKGAKVKGFPLKTQLRLTRSSVWDTVSSPEVIGIMPGSDPVLKDEYVVLMGHLDHYPLVPNAKPGEDAIRNGALDNASGIATMLEAARAFAESGQRPRRSLLFIANTAEEKGLLGADYFANNPTVPIEKIAGVVDLDMPMLLYDFTDVIAFGAEHSTLAKTVARAAASMNIALSADPMPEESIFVRSDHYMFVRQGVPAVFLATGWANGGEEQWKQYLKNAYHKVNDDMKQKINWDAGAKFAKLNYLISRELADADQRPLWYKGDFFGDIFAPNAPKAEKTP